MKFKQYIETLDNTYHGLKKLTKVTPNRNIHFKQLSVNEITKAQKIEDQIKKNDMVLFDRFPLSGSQSGIISNVYDIENKESGWYKYGLRKFFEITYYKDKKTIVISKTANYIIKIL